VRGRRYVGDVEARDVGCVLEHGTELACEALELVISEIEAGQAGHMGSVVARDGVGHLMIVDGPVVYAHRPMDLCQACGSDPRGSWGTNVPRGDLAEGTCADCGRALAAPFNRAVLEDGAPAVEYEFEDWGAEDRAAAADALTARIVPFRWEPGLILAVAAHREADADAVLDELEAVAAVSEDAALPEVEEDWGQGEVAFAALGELFDAADRLFHTPTGTTAANDLRESGAVVRESAPPYGFEPQVWRNAGELALQVETLITEGSNEEIQARAQVLRDAIAPHI
jgi:hypothetical protein